MDAAGQPIVTGARPAVHTMRAAVQEEYGSADVLHTALVPRPEPVGDEVLVRVRAAGLDRGVWHAMTGLPYLGRLAFGLRRPKARVPGFDMAGTVVALGPAATRFAVGDEVFGFGRGAFAEYAGAAQDRLARKPANLSFEEAAVVPVSGVTALQGLDAGRVRPGQRVLVTGASGGVGSYAVQLAKALGAEVTGVASTAKLDLVRSLGADHVIDYGTDDFADGTRHWDLIIDIAGNPPVSRLRRALTRSGTAVITGGEKGDRLTGGLSRQLGAVAMSPFLHQRFTTFVGSVRAADLERLTGLIEAGQVHPSLDRTFALDDVQDAMRYLVAGSARGKVAITP